MTSTEEKHYDGVYPKTAEEWWKLLNDFGEQIQNDFFRYGTQSEWKKFRNAVRGHKNTGWIVHFLNEVWWKLPDTSSIHDIPTFKLLCDLCSEAGAHTMEENS